MRTYEAEVRIKLKFPVIGLSQELAKDKARGLVYGVAKDLMESSELSSFEFYGITVAYTGEVKCESDG